MRYRIEWRILATGQTGHGKYCFTRDQADDMARTMNHAHKDEIEHWFAPEPAALTQGETNENR